jgi:hypothetical protein
MRGAGRAGPVTDGKVLALSQTCSGSGLFGVRMQVDGWAHVRPLCVPVGVVDRDAGP